MPKHDIRGHEKYTRDGTPSRTRNIYAYSFNANEHEVLEASIKSTAYDYVEKVTLTPRRKRVGRKSTMVKEKKRDAIESDISLFLHSTSPRDMSVCELS